MKLHHSLLLIALGLGLSGCTFSSSDDDDDDVIDPEDPVQVALDDLATSELTSQNVLGIGISVRLANGRLYESQAGNIDPTGSAPYSVAGTVQVVGSVTKMYVATMIMQLVEQGVVSLDDTIDAWVTVPSGDRITIRMLLSHTSGLNDSLADFSMEDYARAWTPEQLLQHAIDLGPLAAPGDTYARYSNTNFLVLAMILEQETGETWTDNLAERIAEPLGLEHTSSVTLPETEAINTPGWANIDGNWLSSLDYIDPSVGWGYGAMTATNRELLEFTEAFFGSALFARESTLESMTRFEHITDPDSLGEGEPQFRVGLGVLEYTIDGITLEGHPGSALGYNAAMFHDPETGAMIAVTLNTDTPSVAPQAAFEVAAYLRSSE